MRSKVTGYFFLIVLVLIGATTKVVPAYANTSDTLTWTTKTSMPTARYGFGAVGASNGKIYVIGGNTQQTGSAVQDIVGTVEEYDPSTDTWTTKTSMPTPREGLGVVEVNGKIYAIGGQDTTTLEPDNLVEEYDPSTDTWTTKTGMQTPRTSMAVAVDIASAKQNVRFLI